ncbi:hypothetical protein [Jannaschia ovalis]|uniref:Uncharacterized protein n=1 Tax=Jannaschia ovalis TaxID=3038773 RepID=A0ABY8LBQ5_9RHOB|nr:hypothetical protein [Jannaschia sp. GRR-S6-38]WGH77480.1 hypothetical protein P8627_10545 [Jannaschia sp. GRR-S6-38]
MPTKDVQRFAREEITGAELVAAYPQCACELTEPFDGGHGPVSDDEHLTFFVESKRHFDLTKIEGRKKQSWAPKGSDLRNATTGHGHSVYRTKYASPDELRQAAQAGFRSAVGLTNDPWRGVVGAFTFPVASVRLAPYGDCGQMCVVDTPKLANEGAGKTSEPSHADLLWSDARKGGDDAFIARRRVFEDGIRASLAGAGSFEFLKDFDGADLTDYLPDNLKPKNN